jgi:hypothetical protein
MMMCAPRVALSMSGSATTFVGSLMPGMYLTFSCCTTRLVCVRRSERGGKGVEEEGEIWEAKGRRPQQISRAVSFNSQLGKRPSHAPLRRISRVFPGLPSQPITRKILMGGCRMGEQSRKERGGEGGRERERAWVLMMSVSFLPWYISWNVHIRTCGTAGAVRFLQHCNLRGRGWLYNDSLRPNPTRVNPATFCLLHASRGRSRNLETTLPRRRRCAFCGI